MARKPSTEHPWRNNKHPGYTKHEFIALTATNPHDITPTICPPGNAEDCVLGMDFVDTPLKGVRIREQVMGVVYIGHA